MALVMLSSLPSGIQSIVNARDIVRSAMFAPAAHRSSTWIVPTVKHVDGAFHSYPSPFLYIGFGESDIQGRPSQWANPFLFLGTDAEACFALFSRYVNSRADVVEFLTPLSGAILICDCCMGKWCHGNFLIQAFSERLMDDSAADATSEKSDAMSVACVMEGFEDDDETDIVGAAADDEVLPAPKFNVQIEAINETIRGEAANIYEERPNWLPPWKFSHQP